MAKLTFYRQKRFDGGVRMGLELNDQVIGEHFETGASDPAPYLLWFVDLRCEGPGVPDDPDEAVDWLIEHGPVIRDGFARFAEQLRHGVDRDNDVLKWNGFEPPPEGAEMVIVCSVVRRIDALEFSAVLNDMADYWDERLRELTAPVHQG